MPRGRAVGIGKQGECEVITAYQLAMLEQEWDNASRDRREAEETERDRRDTYLAAKVEFDSQNKLRESAG
jgi:hypothetical protein